MDYQSEAALEKHLVQQLYDLGYDKVCIPDEESLIYNFREQLSLLNATKLRGMPLTNKEFERIMRHMEGKGVFQSAKILRDQFVLERESGAETYIEFFNSKDWKRNRFQVSVTSIPNYADHYHAILLINGLPLVQVELKRQELDLKEAFNQIDRLRKHSYQGLYRYIQIFVLSNGAETKYFANNDKEILYSQTFNWTNVKNERINELSDFTADFLNKYHIGKMIARYMVINETDKMLMVMRPYQIFAVEAVMNCALKESHNGYIWHTTGSGKTLTSFKVSQILANEPEIKKVFFLVERKDLDNHVIKEFKKFEADTLNITETTDKLVDQIKNINKPLIITTTQKMSNAVNSPKYKAILNQYRDEKVIFIIDECHRSQFGKMHRAIHQHFTKAQYFGFTGTPRFKENKSEDGSVTVDLFNKCLHKYLIKDAITDQNVLGFSVEYIETVKGYNHSSEEHKSEDDDVMMSEDRLHEVASHIVSNHSAKTRNREYTSIFAVQSIPMLMSYYDQFKKLNHNLKIVGIFRYSANGKAGIRDHHLRDGLERIVADYNDLYKTNFSAETFSSYFTDVSKRIKNDQIDILLVVKMFLTGFDSKTLNTLYIDKSLKYHGLLQAYSRTNRIEKETKPFGNVVCYRNLKENTDEAIRLFSQTDGTDTVLVPSFNEYLKEFKIELKQLFNIVQQPTDVEQLQTAEAQKKFIISFRELSKVLLRLQTFTHFKFNESLLGISEQIYQDFKSKYFLIHDQLKRSANHRSSVLADIDFCLEIMHTNKINMSYIMRLIGQIDLVNKEHQKLDINEVLVEIDRADNEDLRLKVSLLKEFLQIVIPVLTPEDSIEEAYYEFKKQKQEEEIQNFCQSNQLTLKIIKKFIDEYQYSGLLNHQDISDAVQEKFFQKKKKVKSIKAFIVDLAQKYQ